MSLKPLGDRLIVKALDAEETTSGGILLPDSAKEKPQQGKVIAIGPGKLLDNGKTVAQSIVDNVADRNAGAVPLGDTGVVVGATVSPGELDTAALNGPILAPGFGAQGGTVADLRKLFGADLKGVLPASSRDLLRHGPDCSALRAEVRRVMTSITG